MLETPTRSRLVEWCTANEEQREIERNFIDDLVNADQLRIQLGFPPEATKFLLSSSTHSLRYFCRSVLSRSTPFSRSLASHSRASWLNVGAASERWWLSKSIPRGVPSFLRWWWFYHTWQILWPLPLAFQNCFFASAAFYISWWFGWKRTSDGRSVCNIGEVVKLWRVVTCLLIALTLFCTLLFAEIMRWEKLFTTHCIG